MPENPPVQRAFPDEAILGWMHDFAPYGVFTTDRNFCVQTWNHWMTAHTGKEAVEVINRNLFDLFPELKERRLVPRFERALEGESSLLSTALHRYLLRMDSPIKDTTFHDMQQTARIAPLLYLDKVVGTIVVVEDVTQRELQAQIVRQQHERDTILSWALAHLLESTQPRRGIRELFLKIAEHLDWEAYLLYLFDPGRETLRLHAAAGVTPETEHSLAVLSVSDPVGRALIAAGSAASGANPVLASDAPLMLGTFGFSASAVLPLQSREGQIGLLCFGARSRAALREGELDLLSTIGKYLSVAIHREATHQELRTAQAKLNDYADTLQRQVAERTVKLSEIIADLERFSYTLAHDLRAPIRALTGYSQILLEEFASTLPEEAGSILKSLNRACRQLDDLTLDLLEFSKVSRSDLVMAPVDLEEVVNDALHLIALGQASVAVRRPLLPVTGNRALLQQTILNLIDNAIKFAKDGEIARISIWTEEVASSDARTDPAHSPPFSSAGEPAAAPSAAPRNTAAVRVRIVVQDEGIGIAPELHRKIFGIFERGTSSLKYQGSGIGLAIVARAMERMGGACGVDSRPNAGSRFWLELQPAVSWPPERP